MGRKFLVIVDDSPEFEAALRYAARRARSTGGHVALLRVIPKSAFEHWAGVREEIERELRDEAQRLLQRYADMAKERSGSVPVLLVEEGETRAAIRKALEAEPEIKILVLAAAAGGRGPGPLVSSIAREGFGGGARRLPVTVVPGDLTDEEIEDLA